MSYRLVKSLVTLRDEVDAAYPDRSRTKDGWIGDTAHSKRKSEHNPDAVGRVRAVDITTTRANGNATPNGAALAALCRAHMRSRGVSGYVIHAGTIASSMHGWLIRDYHGADPHDGHVHVSVLSQLESCAPWGVARGASAPLVPPARTGVLDAATVRALQALVRTERDGIMGPATVSALQVMLALDPSAALGGKADGDFGPRTARALERYLGLPETTVPGWYPGLIRSLQSRLAAMMAKGGLK